jgi:AraC-like DNA-binding protein
MMPMVTGFGLARLMTANRQNENILKRNEATQKFAQRLLRTNGGLGLAEVAFRSGFANQSHFCFHFKRIAGVTPRQFRGSERTCDSEQMMRTLTSISVDEDISR